MLRDDYYQWLLDKIDANQEQYVDYSLLLSKLHRTPYTLTEGEKRIVDINRIRRVLELRKEFSDEHFINYPLVAIDSPVLSCLEVLVCLAVDAEQMVMSDSDHGNRTSKWFWLMIGNLGLDKFPDYKYNRYDVEDILERFIKRKYKRNGRGSIAYSTKSKKDFRKMDIWQQLNIYLSENYICA